MKAQTVTLSGKYQIVIPKLARQKMGLDKPTGQRFRVKKVTKNEIVFSKDKTLDDFLGAYDQAFPKDAAAALRRMRDQEWD
jgi:bifunctional DNA-binding transcriptional regulator/antitoxin component of YhaV-PrlF toxin-antitoxin module